MELLECAICLEIITDERKKIKNFCSCKYNYHINCFLEYYIKELKCPICKKKDYNLITYIIYKEYVDSYYSYENLIKYNSGDKLKNIYVSPFLQIKITRMPKYRTYLHNEKFDNLDLNMLQNLQNNLEELKKYKTGIKKLKIKNKIINMILLDIDIIFNESNLMNHNFVNLFF